MAIKRRLQRLQLRAARDSRASSPLETTAPPRWGDTSLADSDAPTFACGWHASIASTRSQGHCGRTPCLQRVARLRTEHAPMLGVSERGPRRETGEGDRATPPSITTARVAQLPRAQGRRAAAAPSDPTSGRTSAGKDRAATQVGRGAAVRWPRTRHARAKAPSGAARMQPRWRGRHVNRRAAAVARFGQGDVLP